MRLTKLYLCLSLGIKEFPIKILNDKTQGVNQNNSNILCRDKKRQIKASPLPLEYKGFS
jgi:hypothetical protein